MSFTTFPNAGTAVQGGLFIFGFPSPVYGANTMTEGFTLNSQAVNLLVKWYGSKKGAPPAIQGTLLENGVAVATSIVPASSITPQSGNYGSWQAPFSFTGIFGAGSNYQLAISTSGGDASNNYQVWLLAVVVSDGAAIYNAGLNSSSGNSVLWVADGLANTMALYPFEALSLTFPNPQTFVAPFNFSFQGLVFYVGDRHWNPQTATVTVRDASTGAVLSVGVLDQFLTSGYQGFCPVTLNSLVSCTAGKTYSISISEAGAQTWAAVIRGMYVDPMTPNLVTDYKVPVSSFVPIFSDLNSITTTGFDAVGFLSPSGVFTQSTAVSFIPSVNANLKEFHVLMKAYGGLPQMGNHASGDTLLASLYASASAATTIFSPTPPGTSLQSVQIQSQSIPWNGFLDVTGFSASLAANTRYWMVISTTSTTQTPQGPYPMARFVSPYKFEVLGGYANQTPFWNYMGEGPTDLSFRVVTGSETIGNFITDIPEVGPPNLSTGAMAQPFIAPSNLNVNGVTLGSGVKLGGTWNSYASISINPDAGGVPSLTPLGGGKFHVAEYGFDGAEYVGFDTVAPLVSGGKYWLVARAGTGITTMKLFPIIYYLQPTMWPSGLNAMTYNGSAWTSVLSGYPTSVAAVVPFWLSNQTAPTQATTVLSLRAVQS